jgi:nitrogen regulatory protein PII
MKMVITFVQPFMTERVIQALHRIEGLSGATCTSVQGFGRGRGHTAEHRREEVEGAGGAVC